MHLDDYKTSFLTGKEESTEPHFIKARREIAASNDLGLLTIAYLTKYALHTASLESFDSSEFAKLYKLEPNPSDMAYCHLLKGNFTAVDMQGAAGPLCRRPESRFSKGFDHGGPRDCRN